MYSRDYILRMVEMMAELIAGILGLIKKGDLKQAEEKIDAAYHEFLKEDAGFFTSIPKEKLTDELLEKHNYNDGHLEILAELFYVEAELQIKKGNKEAALEFYQKSLLLMEYIDKTTKSFSMERQSKIAEIKSKCSN